jgi:hypothetical protein
MFLIRNQFDSVLLRIDCKYEAAECPGDDFIFLSRLRKSFGDLKCDWFDRVSADAEIRQVGRELSGTQYLCHIQRTFLNGSASRLGQGATKASVSGTSQLA